MNDDNVLYMNTSTCDDEDKIPFPARQQLGDHGGLKDARSGNGVDEELGGSGLSGGTSVLPVTYHLEGSVQPMVVTGQSNVADESVSEHHTQREQHGRDKKIVDSGAGQGPSRTTVTGSDVSDQGPAMGGGADSAQDRGATVSGDQSGADADNDDSATDDGDAGEKLDVPDGNTQEVLTWVGQDKQRAFAAIEAENKRSQPRRTLIAQLNDRV